MAGIERKTNSFDIDNYLDRIINEPSKIFKNREVMSSTYVPQSLPHRDEQIKKIFQVLAPVLQPGNRTISNLFLYGKSGTGKTAVTMFVLQHIKKKCIEYNINNVKQCVINCRHIDTSYRVFARLCEFIGIEIPFTGLPTDIVYDRFKTELEKFKNGILIIVLDEIDQLLKKNKVNKTPNKALYLLTRINSFLKNARIHLISISNDLNFKNYLDSRILSSLSEEEIVFPPYNSIELEDILRERAKMGLYEGVLDEGTISLAAAMAASEHGDARRAIDLLRVAAELAERNNCKKMTQDHVREAIKNIEHDKIKDAIETLPIQSKLVLLGIFFLEEKNYADNTTGDVYSAYIELCNKLSLISPLTQRRVSDLINELDMLGLINAKIVNLGRHGRTKKIKLNISRQSIIDMIVDDASLHPILNYKLKYKKE